MSSRMHCTDCGTTDFADTRLEGSDAFEGLAWLLGGLPGWLYCAWRHAGRAKRCAHCGGEALLRESRAAWAKAAWPAPPHFGTGIESEGGALRWPAPLRDPKQRLLRGLPWLAGWALAALGLGAAGVALVLGCALAEGLRATQWGGSRGVCRVWDDSGRALGAEWV